MHIIIHHQNTVLVKAPEAYGRCKHGQHPLFTCQQDKKAKGNIERNQAFNASLAWLGRLQTRTPQAKMSSRKARVNPKEDHTKRKKPRRKKTLPRQKHNSSASNSEVFGNVLPHEGGSRAFRRQAVLQSSRTTEEKTYLAPARWVPGIYLTFHLPGKISSLATFMHVLALELPQLSM